MSAKAEAQAREVFVVECAKGCCVEHAERTQREAQFMWRHTWPHCQSCGGRIFVTKYIEAPKARRVKG